MSMQRIARLAYRITHSNLRELPRPYRLTYAVTNRCQARCTMCDIWRKPAENELTLAEIDALFTRANRFSWINLTGGELFQRPDISDIFLTVIQRSRDLYLLNFPTNGFQTEEIVAAVDAILKQTALPRLIVSVSLDGPRELHDRIRNLPGCWDRALGTFRQLRERRSRRFSVFLGHTLQVANLGEFDKTFAACREELGALSADDLHINLAHVSGLYYGNNTFDGTPEPAEASRLLVRINTQRRHKPFSPIAFIERRYQQLARIYLKDGTVPLTCQAAAASCFIDPTGNVFPCSGFASLLGSLRENDMDLYRIWRSPIRLHTRKQVHDDACPGCWTPCEAYQTILANLLQLKGKNR